MKSFVKGMRRDMGNDWGHDFDEFIEEAGHTTDHE